MAWKIWKGKGERAREEWNKGVNLRNQGRWNDAANHFEKAARLFEEEGFVHEAQMAKVLSSLYYAAANPTAENLMACSNYASALPADEILEIPQKVSAGDLAVETRLLSGEAKVTSLIREVSLQNIGDAEAEEIRELAAEFLSLGRDNFVVGALFSAASESPAVKGNRLMGISTLAVGYSLLLSDPAAAATRFSEALGYFKLAEDEERGRVVEVVAKKAGQVAKCWFCGREVQGEEAHFIYMEANLTPYLMSRYGDETPVSSRDGGIVACVACNSAIEIAADRIAKEYYEKAMKALAEVREELLAMINALLKRIERLESVAHRH